MTELSLGSNNSGLLHEHEAPQKEEPKDYEPNEKEKKALKLVNKLLKKGKNKRKQYDERFLDYYKMFRGKQWRTSRPSYRASEVINLIFPHIQTAIAIMTDSRPKIDFLPVEPTDTEFADIVGKAFDYDWEINNWSEVLVEALYDMEIYGTGIGHMFYNKEKDYEIGGMDFVTEDPHYIIPDPNGEDVNKKSKWFMTAVPTDIEVVKEKYPKKAKYIKADIEDFAEHAKSDLGPIKFRSPTDANVLLEGHGIQDEIETQKTLLITLYIKDTEKKEEKKTVKDEKTGQDRDIFENRLVYPKGRKIVVAGKVVLEDGPMNDEDCGRFPFARLVNYHDPRQFWGISEIEQLESPQKLFNKFVSFVVDVLALMGNPIWIISNDSGIDTDGVYNQPGMILEPEPDTSEVRRVEGAQLQPYVIQMIERFEMWFNNVSGTTEVSKGIKPGGVTAARAIESLQDAGQTRLRLKMRNLDRFMKQIGRIYTQNILKHYTIPRVVRVTGDQNANKYFKFHIEERDGKKIGIVREADENGKLSEAKEISINGDLDTRSVTVTGLPFMKAEREQKLFNLYDRQVIDAEELLEGIEYPNREAVIERLKQQAAMAAQQPAQQ